MRVVTASQDNTAPVWEAAIGKPAIPAPQWIRRAVRRRRLVPRRCSLRDRRRLPDQALLDPFVT